MDVKKMCGSGKCAAREVIGIDYRCKIKRFLVKDGLFLQEKWKYIQENVLYSQKKAIFAVKLQKALLIILKD